ncbi:MAG: PAS domain S-box-containing protein [Parvicellaceae bacterium]|jgi:PAS domain S-box-containing protein
MKSEIVDIEEVKELIFAYAIGDYEKRAKISENRDERDTILGAINMLGEELETTTVSRDYFSSIYNAVAEMLFLINEDLTIDEYNDAIKRELEFDEFELKGQKLNSIITFCGLNQAQIKKVQNNELEFFTSELFLTTKQGSEIPVSVTISKIPDDANNRILVIAKNITDQKKTEQLVLRTIIDTEESERKRLAFDLHDSLGQEMNAIKMYLNVASYGEIDVETKKNIESCKSMLESSIDSIRKIVFDLLPASLDKGNLDLAISQLVNSLQAIHPIDFNYEVIGEIRPIEKHVEVAIYRVVQEFINNTLKHAEADSLIIKLEFTPSKLSIELKDNGSGFDQSVLKDRGNGVKHMESRVGAINGKFKFFSLKDEGTLLQATFKI